MGCEIIMFLSCIILKQATIVELLAIENISEIDVNIDAVIKHNRKQAHTSRAPQNKTINLQI